MKVECKKILWSCKHMHIHLCVGCVQQQSPSGEPMKGKRRKALTDHLLHRKRKVTLVDEKKIADFNSSMTI